MLKHDKEKTSSSPKPTLNPIVGPSQVCPLDTSTIFALCSTSLSGKCKQPMTDWALKVKQDFCAGQTITIFPPLNTQTKHKKHFYDPVNMSEPT